MKVKRKVQFFLSSILVCLIIVLCVANALFAYEAKPLSEIQLGDEMHQSQPMFAQGDGPWYPGKTAKKTLRIHNKYPHNIEITNLSLNMKLQKLQGEEFTPVNDVLLAKTYAQNMLLNIKKGKFSLLDKTIYDSNFYEMLYDANNENLRGYNLPEELGINIGSGKYVDLEYNVQMDENAGNELQGIQADVDFKINFNGYPGEDNSNNGDDHKPFRSTSDEVNDADGRWAHDCIITLLKHGIIKGYPDGTIRPNYNITRAEAAALVANALDLEFNEDILNPYSDPLPEWAKKYILVTTEKDIFVGYPPDLFKASKYITREEMTCILVKAFAHKLNQDRENIAVNFTDSQQISFWAGSFVTKAAKNDIISGYPDKTFKPQNNITRAEAFTIICKLLGLHNEHTDSSYQGI